jgi:serine/threonine-protein kinase
MMPFRILLSLLVLVMTTAASTSSRGSSSLGLDPAHGTVGTAVTASAANFTCEGATRVPDLIGDTEAEARGELRAVGLGLGATDGSGIVYKQDPAAHTVVDEGTSVAIWLKRTVAVPDLIGDTEAEARGELRAVGLGLGATDGSGIVYKQDPAAHTVVDEGTSVAIWLSFQEGRAATDARPPKVASALTSARAYEVSLRSATAEVALSWDGKRLAGTDQALDDSLDFTVPDARPGSHTVTLECLSGDNAVTASFTVDSGPVIVPSLLGLRRDRATDSLEDARLEVGRMIGAGPVVTRQKPVAGTEVEPGHPVNIWLDVDTVPVPDLTGDTAAQAETELTRAGLTLGRVHGQGRVASQSPGPNAEVTPGSSVGITLAPVLVRVPDLEGLTINEVRTILAEYELRLATPTGDGERVTRQRPAPGKEVPRGSLVSVGFGAKPGKLMTVPDLGGSFLAEAEAQLVAVGLILGPQSGDGDRVTAQTPLANSRVTRGTVVSVSLQRTVPPPPMATVPDLTGLSVESAGAKLDAVELVLGPVSGEGNEVVNQRPDPGTTLPVGSVVSVTLDPTAVAPPLVRVPGVLGITPKRAAVRLRSVGLALGRVTGRGRKITGQNPRRGVSVALGTEVSASLGGAPPLESVPVPNLVKLTFDVARNRVEGFRLRLRPRGEGGEGSTIESQDPDAGTYLAAGGTVTVAFTQAAQTSPVANHKRGLRWTHMAGVAVAVLLGGAGAAKYTRVRSRHELAWAQGHLSIVPGVRIEPEAKVREWRSDGDTPTHAVRLEPHPDEGTYLVKEDEQ